MNPEGWDPESRGMESGIQYLCGFRYMGRRVATFGSTFSNSLLNNVLKHGFLPFNSSKDMNFPTFGYTDVND